MEPWREELYHSELYHYGVLGQRWGIRNYQNKDGSLTLAGKLRYRASSVDKIKSKKGTMNRLKDLNTGIKKNRRYTKINRFLERHYTKKMDRAGNAETEYRKKKWENARDKAKDYSYKAAKTAEYERKGREEYNRLMGNLSPNDLVKMTPAYKKQQRELKKQRKQIKKMKRRL